jgi:ferric-dicitrate binding protein FerR (iron transport regulator)
MTISSKDRARADRSGLFRYAAASSRTELPTDDAAPTVKKVKEKAAPRSRAPKRPSSPKPVRRSSSATTWATTAAIVGLSVAGVLGLSLIYSPGANLIGRAAAIVANGGSTAAPTGGFAAIEATPNSASAPGHQPLVQSASRPPDETLIEVAP